MSAGPTFRTTSYEIRSGTFTGTTYTLTLRRNLAEHYFVLIEWSGAGNADRGPDANDCRVTKDPFGTGDLGATAAANQLELTRGAATGEWQGVIKVVECVGDHDAGGFRLRAVRDVAFGATQLGKTVTLAVAERWTSLSKVTLFGGLRGGGVSTAVSNVAGHQSGWAAFNPTESGADDQITADRKLTGGTGTGAATFTVYVIEWGSEWTIQRAIIDVASNNGGDALDAASEWESVTISQVTRAKTWAVASAAIGDDGIGDGVDGMAVNLGDGPSTNATETKVAVGNEEGGNQLRAIVAVLSHPDLAVDWRMGADGASTGIETAVFTKGRTVNAAIGQEGYDNASSSVRWTEGSRIALIANSMNSTATGYPRPHVAARMTASSTCTWGRTRNGEPGAYVMQVVDFVGIVSPATPAATAIVLVAPDVSVAKSLAIAPSPAAIALAVPDPTLDLTLQLAPDPAAISFAVPAVTVAKSLTVTPSPAAIVLAAPAPTLDLSLQASADATAIVLVAPAVTVAKTLTVLPDPAAIALAAPSPALDLTLQLAPDPAAIVLAVPAVAVSIVGTLILPSPTAIVLVVPAVALGRLHWRETLTVRTALTSELEAPRAWSKTLTVLSSRSRDLANTRERAETLTVREVLADALEHPGAP